ncbi:MAG: translocation/assembly module TamB domain-containing protein, partial [Acidobacteriia bacterium]|nr:translocation/assembly module TamB domain-containing protein [Terriglobia bacterium]
GTPVSGHVSAVYDATAETLDLGNSVVNLPSSRVAVSGSLGRQINARLETRNLNDFLPLLGANVQPLPLKLENGSLLFDGTLSGKPQDPHIAGRLTLNQFSVSGEKFDSLASAVNASPTSMRLQDAALARGPLRARFEGALGLRNWEASTASPISARATVRNIGVQEVLARLGQTTVHAAGTLNASAAVSGTVGQPQATGQIEIVKGSFDTEPFDRLTANLSYESRKLEATSGQINAGAKQVRFNVAFDHPAGNLQNGSMRFDIQSNSLPLAQLATLNKLRPGIEGTAQLTAKGALAVASSGVRITALNGDLTARGLQLPNTPLRDVHMTAQTEASPNQTPILRTRFDSGFATSTLHGEGELRLEGDYPGSANIKFSRLDLADLQHWLAPSNQSSPLKGFAEGEIRISGPARMPGQMRGELRVASFELGPASSQVFTLRNEGPIVATAANSVVTIESARLRGSATDVTIGGRVLLNQKNPFDLRANGKLDLGLLHTLDAGFTSSGTATLEAALRGSLSAPQVDGRVQIENASVSHADFPNGIANARGLILFAGDRATIQNLTGETGGGQIRLSGFGGFAAGRPVFGLEVETKGVRIRYPEGISTVSNASLNFNGSGDRSMLTGTVSVLRSNLNLQSDLSSIMAKSAEPVRAPAANTGFFGGLNFDVQVQTAPDAQIESSLTQGVQAEANLRLRGTANNPALQGRINIYQGQAVFFGTKYSISQGSVSFYNPVAIEPVLDVDLATKARGIDITLTVAGPLDKLTVTPRSDPPLQFDEIVSVLATGSYPADTSLRVQQSAIPSAGQQSTSSALLGQVLATPVTGRLQRFFGVSGIRIDPTLPGTEYNPQARVTIQQQVTPDVTFTYIANVTQANPQVVSVEWAASKQWSVVAQREENGLIGLDFFFKKRFK